MWCRAIPTGICSWSPTSFAKRTAISEYRLQGRNGYGVKAVQLAEGRGSLVGAVIVEESDQIMAIMKSGKVIRSNVAEVKRTGRTTRV